MANVSDIRKTFLSYFERHGHKVVTSSNLVPENDPTLMFVNSGMVQFKNIFTGQEKRNYKTAVTSQKCVRAGGKHNDLENVGHTARHHTFFEMLGNFSFGNYFKEKAIFYAWELLTKEFGFSKEKLLVTVFHEDEEAKLLWKKIASLEDNKIIPIKTSDNFWSMGDTGPCGPCSEIFFDHGENVFGGPPGSKNEDGDRFIEIWNLVFMQYEQISKNKRINLPKPSIDTGMGLERLAAVLQGKHDNYEIDLLQTLINDSANKSSSDANGKFKTSHRVIVDHLRSASFLIADGVLPSNEGRGYVLRRIMRRGMRHAHLLGCKDPLLFQLTPTLLKEMGSAFPELIEAKDIISETLKHEENKFKETLDRGIKILEEETKNLQTGKNLDGKVAFKLYDTYGFPLDLTQDILKSRDLGVDIKEFDKEMEKQRVMARSSWKGSGDNLYKKIWLDLSNKLKPTKFIGYKNLVSDPKVNYIINNGKYVNEINNGEIGELIFKETPFYATSGGQVSDNGTIENSNFCAQIIECWKTKDNIIIHKVKVKSGSLKVGQIVSMKVDVDSRKCTASNHSSTHILHQALKDVLGDHISQKGSLVSSDRLRFDFSHPKSIIKSDLLRIEEIVNEKIRDNSEINIRQMNINDSKKEGATALFGEKYSEIVRVVSMGGKLKNKRSYWSLELCGGTHAKRTGDIGLLKIINESSISSGVRRIEAITGKDALNWINEKNNIINSISEYLKISTDKILEKITSLNDEKKKIEKEFQTHKSNNVFPLDNSEEVREIGQIKFIGKIFNEIAAKNLKGMADNYLDKVNNGIIALISIENNKISLVVAVTDELSKKINAIDLVKHGAKIFGGKGGGGRPTMAQSGGNDVTAAQKTLNGLINVIEDL